MKRSIKIGVAIVTAAVVGVAAVHFSGRSAQKITERAKQPLAVDPDAPSAKLIPGDDLPPPGTRSLFDHVVAQNDVLPYPFEKLIALLGKQDPANQPPLVVMIPQGRSLLKASA